MENILIKDEKELAQKIARIAADGVSSLHVITDFDRTLTKYYVDGQKVESGFSLIRSGGYLTKDYPPKAYALYDTYHPYEIDDTLDWQEKNRLMTKWWSTHLELMIASGLNKKVINDIIQKKYNMLREGSQQFILTLYNKQIPLLIFSAGLGDLIKGFLEKNNCLKENIHIIANFYHFDKEGQVLGYKDKIIHTFNKNKREIRNLNLKGRKNILLLGDSLGDLGMSEGLEYDTIIRVGFLNEPLEEKKEQYLKAYDIVITNDGTMEYVNELLQRITLEL